MQESVDILFEEIMERLQSIAENSETNYVNYQSALTVAYKMLRRRIATEIEILDCMNRIDALRHELNLPISKL